MFGRSSFSLWTYYENLKFVYVKDMEESLRDLLVGAVYEMTINKGLC